MPHSPGVRDKVGDLAVEIADMMERIRYLQEEINRAEATVTKFVESIENDQTRMIFRLLLLRCLTWGEVAAVIGGRNTEMALSRPATVICHLEKLQRCDAERRLQTPCMYDMLKLVKSYKARRSFFGGAAILFRKEVEAGALLLAHRSCAGPDVRQHRQRRHNTRRSFLQCTASSYLRPIQC